MSSVPTLPGITSQMIPTKRINQHVLTSGPEGVIPVVFVHGNFSAATYLEETMLAMPDKYRCIAPDLRGYGDTEDLLIDGTRGARDWSDDLKALSDLFGDKPAHLVGWSLGAAVWVTGVITLLMLGVFEEFAQTPAGSVIIEIAMAQPALIGFGLAIGALDQQAGNTPIVWVTAIWNSLTVAAYALLLVLAVVATLGGM